MLDTLSKDTLRTFTITLGAALGLLGCSGEGEGKDVDQNDVTGPSTTTPQTTPNAPELADQVTLGKVSLYQGVESILWAGGGAPSGQQAPVIAGRDATLRVFLRADPAFAGTPLTVSLTATSAAGEVAVGEVTQPVEEAATDEDLGSTYNFDLAGADVALDTELRIEIRTADASLAPIVWDSSADLPAGLPTGDTDDLTVVVIPIQYDADGSGRLPDTSQARLDELRDAMYAVYPARSVTIRVEEPLPWTTPIGATNPLQWTGLRDAVSAMRADALDETANTYYYGLFVTTDTFEEFCGAGCILGLSQLGFNTTNPALRSSVGVGYPEYAASTMVHEIGHAHGRFHAPCGGAAGADPGYPYDGALIGSWGYDVRLGELKDPSVYTDIMAYCEPIWISNYTYYSLWERIAALGAQGTSRVASRTVTQLRTDGHGETKTLGTVRLGDPSLGGIPVAVDTFDASGAPAGQVPGWLYPNSHFAGGVVTLDHVLPDGWTAQVQDPELPDPLLDALTIPAP